MKSILQLVYLLGFVASFVASESLLAQTSLPETKSSAPSVKDERTRAKIHTELGALYYQDGNIPVAMEELTVAIYIDPKYAPAYSMRALVHHYLKEPNHAEDNFKQAIALTPDDPEIANNYGWFLCQIGRDAEAMPYFAKAIQNRMYQTPDRAYLNAGQCAMKLGNVSQAAEYLEMAHRLSGESPVTAFRLAEIRYSQGAYSEAKRLLSDLVKAVEPTSEVLWLVIRVERKLGDRQAEMNFTSQLRRKFATSKEYQELLKGNYE